MLRLSQFVTRRFPLDKVKIDKAFISEIPDSAEDKAIVGVIASLAGTLGLTLVAEGIERAEQAEAMREMGVRFGQGYFYQRPQPLEAVLRRLERRPRAASSPTAPRSHPNSPPERGATTAASRSRASRARPRS